MKYKRKLNDLSLCAKSGSSCSFRTVLLMKPKKEEILSLRETEKEFVSHAHSKLLVEQTQRQIEKRDFEFRTSSFPDEKSSFFSLRDVVSFQACT